VAAGPYTTSTAFLEALAEAGVRYIFANLGSDHPGLIEALAWADAGGHAGEFPRLIVCPHETVALCAAHAYASVSREPQAVLVHVDAGTQNLGGAVSNAMRGRVPVLIFAGASRPGSLLGSGGGSLGWAGGGAVGAKLACPERAVVCLTGDGSFLFGVPSSAQWVARRYGTPSLTIIYDNRGRRPGRIQRRGR
jgi:thiamine pyrophosphate-dependent acetolactate synthase large subunit-like protein